MYIGSNIALRAFQEYVNRIRIGEGSTPTDGANLLSFVEGVNDLGLWNSMVCWPLRSFQNAGTGSKAFAIGGWPLISANSPADLSLINAPSWGTSGITTDGATSYLTTSVGASAPLSPTSSVTQVLCGVDLNATKASRTFSQILGGGTIGTGLTSDFRQTGAYVGFVSDVGNANQTLGNGTTLTPALGSTFVSMMAWANGSQGYSMNGAGYSTSAITCPGVAGSINATDKLSFYLGRSSAVGALPSMRAAASIIFNTSLTSQQMSDVYSLYKATLGQGLSLP